MSKKARKTTRTKSASVMPTQITAIEKEPANETFALVKCANGSVAKSYDLGRGTFEYLETLMQILKNRSYIDDPVSNFICELLLSYDRKHRITPDEIKEIFERQATNGESLHSNFADMIEGALYVAQTYPETFAAARDRAVADEASAA
jgi:hypothetical protein